MTALPEPVPGLGGDDGLLLIERQDRAFEVREQCLEVFGRFRPALRLRDDGRLDEGRRGHRQLSDVGHAREDPLRVGLTEDDRHQCGRVDDHCGNPLSS